MALSGSATLKGGARRRPVVSARPTGSLPAAQRAASQAVRMNLFVLVRILFQYLERVDKSVLTLAKEVLKDCERKHNSKDSKYDTLADAIAERVRDAVGEAHWAQARKIQKQLALNQQKKKIKAMQEAKQRQQQREQERMATAAQQQQAQQQRGTLAEALDVAKTMSALSRGQLRSPAPPAMSAAPACPALPMGGGMVPPIGVMRTARGGASAPFPNSDNAGGRPAAGGGQRVPLKKRITFAPSSMNPPDRDPPPPSGYAG